MKLSTKLGALAAFALCTISVPALAEGELYRAKPPPESPQHFELELRFTPYSPRIDYQAGLRGTPYNDTFGASYRVLASFEFDWQALRIPHFGTIGPGLSVGYTSASGSATYTANGKPSAESTSLEVIPFYGVAVLRVDVFERDFGVPLVPYGKVGVGVALWRASNDSGTSSTNGIDGKGTTWGTHFALGLGLSMNWLDRRAAHSLDGAIGINDTLLFGEWTFMNLDGFGSNDKLLVGMSTFTGGLAFAF